VLYAMPHDLWLYNTVGADIPRLLTIASVTHKYHFHMTANWAISSAFRVLSDTYGSPDYKLCTASTALLARVLDVALRCGHEPLAQLAEDAWARRILARKLHPRRALALADAHGLRLLAGVAYYAQLLEMGNGFEDPLDGRRCSAPDDASDNTSVAASEELEDLPELTTAQRRRLLSGHWSLVRLWEQLSARSPVFQRPEGCTYHARGCLLTWATVWAEAARTEATRARPPADVLGRLGAMEAWLTADLDLQTALTPACRRRALTAVKEIMGEVREGLAGHFVDLTVRAHAGDEGDSD